MATGLVVVEFVWHHSIAHRRIPPTRRKRHHGGGSNLPFPIDFHGRPYNTLTLPCERVITMCIISHAHTVVWECCKDDHRSQWGMAKFNPQRTLNPWTDRHQIWNTWLRRGYLPPQKIGVDPPRGFCPHIRKIYTQNLQCLLLFSRFIRAPRDVLVGPIVALNTSYDVVLRKEVPFGVRKFNFKI